MIEILFDILFMLIVEGSLEAATSKKIPMLVRILILLIFLMIYGGFALMLCVFGIKAIQEAHIAAGSFFLLAAIGLIELCVYLFASKYWENNQQKNEFI